MKTLIQNSMELASKGNTELRDKVNADLKKLYDEGKIDELAKIYGIEDMICLGDK